LPTAPACAAVVSDDMIEPRNTPCCHDVASVTSGTFVARRPPNRIAEIGTPFGSSHSGAIDGHCEAGAVKRAFGWAAGVSDFGVAYVNSLPDTIHCVRVREDPLFVVLPWNHPLAKTKAQHIKLIDLRDADLISLGHNSHTQRMIDGAAVKAGIALRQVLVAPGFQDVIQFVRAGVGVGIMPGEALPKRRDFAVRTLMAPALSMSIGVITLRERHLTPVASRLLKMTLEFLKARPSLKSHRDEDAA